MSRLAAIGDPLGDQAVIEYVPNHSDVIFECRKGPKAIWTAPSRGLSIPGTILSPPTD
ncbi:hypothetical protein HLY00_5050 [Mycolicibacterium hippocampi]|uniref:Uncharacterized protein n=1 Tax=Mycolicibacterium hippocampi TaxID=659824 RepID=A0A850PRV5_9MYCO|nr:hypothetical protein [Mycolicibacterium hippocampi]